MADGNQNYFFIALAILVLWFVWHCYSCANEGLENIPAKAAGTSNAMVPSQMPSTAPAPQNVPKHLQNYLHKKKMTGIYRMDDNVGRNPSYDIRKTVTPRGQMDAYNIRFNKPVYESSGGLSLDVRV